MPQYGGGTVRGGYAQAQNEALQRRAMDMQNTTQGLSILSSLSQQQAKQQEQQRLLAQEQAFRAELQALGPNATQEQLAGVAAKYSGPKEILTSQTASLDRKAQIEATKQAREAQMAAAAERATADRDARLEAARVRVEGVLEAARQRGADAQTLKAMELSGREHLTKLAASLRPPPQPRPTEPLVPIVGPDGQPTLVERKDAVNKTPAAAGSKAEATAVGKADVDRDIMTLKSSLDQLYEGGGITSTSKGTAKNIASWAANTGPGQMLGSMGGTYNQKARDVISQARPLLLRSIMQATGMSARSLDSNAELKLWLSVATDPTKGYEANVEALNNIAGKYGSGRFMEKNSPEVTAPKRRASDAAGKRIKFDAQGNPI